MTDMLQTGEFPIVLGNTLKNGTTGSGTFLGLKYNWTPKTGLMGSEGRLRKSKESISITYNKFEEQYMYAGHSQSEADGSELVLIYDAEKSVYVLERLTASIELNLKSATGKSSEEVKRLPQLKKRSRDIESMPNGHQSVEEPSEDDEGDGRPADPSNPYDYRHFLAEAREIVERTSGNAMDGITHPNGSNTSHSGFGSPVHEARNAFGSTTPQFGPTKVDSKKREPLPKESSGRRFFGKAKSKPVEPDEPGTRSKASPHTKRQMPLSAERVVDSSSEDEKSSRPAQKPKLSGKPEWQRSHRKNDSSDVEMQNVSVSGTDSPRPRQNGFAEDYDMHKKNEEEEEPNPYLSFINDNDDLRMDQDEDVDELILDESNSTPPPRAVSPEPLSRQPTPPPVRSRKPIISSNKAGKPRRKSSATAKRKKSEPARQDTTEDDDGLGAMLEAALEQEKNSVGLGITRASDEEQEADGAESVISEEE